MNFLIKFLSLTFYRIFLFVLTVTTGIVFLLCLYFLLHNVWINYLYIYIYIVNNLIFIFYVILFGILLFFQIKYNIITILREELYIILQLVYFDIVENIPYRKNNEKNESTFFSFNNNNNNNHGFFYKLFLWMHNNIVYPLSLFLSYLYIFPLLHYLFYFIAFILLLNTKFVFFIVFPYFFIQTTIILYKRGARYFHSSKPNLMDIPTVEAVGKLLKKSGKSTLAFFGCILVYKGFEAYNIHQHIDENINLNKQAIDERLASGKQLSEERIRLASDKLAREASERLAFEKLANDVRLADQNYKLEMQKLQNEAIKLQAEKARNSSIWEKFKP
jgi:hypothetical protein